MADATITAKGQVTIPAEVRRALGVEPNDKVTFTPMPDGTVVLRAKTRTLSDIGGLLQRKGRVTVPLNRLGLGKR